MVSTRFTIILVEQNIITLVTPAVKRWRKLTLNLLGGKRGINKLEAILNMSLCFFVSDLHGQLNRYQVLFSKILEEKPAAVFLGGDLLPSFGNMREGNFLLKVQS